jgi:hypothetical protein
MAMENYNEIVQGIALKDMATKYVEMEIENSRLKKELSDTKRQLSATEPKYANKGDYCACCGLRSNKLMVRLLMG